MSRAQTMKAVVIDRYGTPERQALQSVPVPEPARGEVRVAVHAATVGRNDTLPGHPFFARAATGLLRSKMQTLGMDFAGVVDALGPGVTAFGLGERVFGLSPGRFGARAEFLCVQADGAIARISIARQGITQ